MTSVALDFDRNAKDFELFWLNDLLKLGGTSKKKRYFLGIFPNRGGRGHPISQNFCKITKSFLACQIHPKMLKHVFHTGGSNI